MARLAPAFTAGAGCVVAGIRSALCAVGLAFAAVTAIGMPAAGAVVSAAPAVTGAAAMAAFPGAAVAVSTMASLAAAAIPLAMSPGCGSRDPGDDVLASEGKGQNGESRDRRQKEFCGRAAGDVEAGFVTAVFHTADRCRVCVLAFKADNARAPCFYPWQGPIFSLGGATRS
jgi:hypothetical protein